MNRLRARLTYANVMATIAVFIALGGASYAAVKVPKNSVGTKQIKNNAVTAAKIKNGAVTGAKINLSTLGTVPRATSADTASSADSAKTATSATHADAAANADALGGSPPQSFMRADRFAFGTADTEPNTPQTVLTLGGVEVTTNRPETTPEQFAVRIVNHNADQWEFTTTGEPGIISVGEGQRGVLGPITTAGSMVIDGRDRVEPGKAIVIECGSDIAPDLLECFAQLSPSA